MCIRDSQHTHPVHHSRGPDVETRQRLVDHGFDGGLGHPGVVFEFHRTDRLAIAAFAHRAHEAGHRAHASIAGPQAGDLGAEVEVLGLDADA